MKINRIVLYMLALGVFHCASVLAEDRAVDYYLRGFAKAKNGDFDGAIKDFARTTEIDPKFMLAYFNSGNSKAHKGDLDGAIADYTRAIELDASFSNGYVNRGNLKRKKGDFDGAIADFTRVMELEPKFAPAYCNRGSARQDKGEIEAAIADYTRSIELDPRLTIAYYGRGSCKIEMRLWVDALADFRRCSKLDNSGQDLPRFFIWYVRARQGETEEANKELSEYLEKRRKNGVEDWSCKQAAFLLGKVPEKEFLSAAEAIKDTDELCFAWFHAGMKQLLAGDKTAAADYFRKCVATEQKNLVAYKCAKSELKALEK